MKVELTRFRVRPGKSERVDEWMRTLNERRAECLATFEREQMYVEAIFREKTAEADFLYWFSIQGVQGEGVETSPHAIDRVHRDFWAECVDSDHGPDFDFDPQLVLMREGIASDIDGEDR